MGTFISKDKTSHDHRVYKQANVLIWFKSSYIKCLKLQLSWSFLTVNLNFFDFRPFV